MKDDPSPVAAADTAAAPAPVEPPAEAPPEPPVEPIAAARLQRMLLDPDMPEALLRPYLMLDHTASAPFAPVVRVNPHRLQETLTEGALALSSLNGLARWRRRRRYGKRIRGWDGPRIVSEGDSWFQYPLLLRDVIDHLMDDHAVLSLGAAGDLLADMLRRDELLGAVAAERADVVLLSAGGNDLLGAGGLARALEPFDPARVPEDYLGPAFERFLAATLAGYRRLVEAVTAARPGVRVIAHGYDRAVPRAGRWLGRPMAALGIEDPALQAAIVGGLVDRFHDGLVALSRGRGLDGQMRVVEARGAVGARWHDELHPVDAGYAGVAALFRAAIRDALREAEGAGDARIAGSARSAGSARIAGGARIAGDARSDGSAGSAGSEAAAGLSPAESAEPEARTANAVRPGPAAAAPEAVGRAAARLAAAHGEAALVREAGRRVALAEMRTALPLGLDLEAIPASSVEGVGDGLMALGARVLDRAEREARALLCGAEPEAAGDRDALREALGLGGEALAARLALLLTGGALGLPAFAASVVAAVLLKRFGGAAWAEVCEAWGERLDATGASGPPGVGGGARASDTAGDPPLGAEGVARGSGPLRGPGAVEAPGVLRASGGCPGGFGAAEGVSGVQGAPAAAGVPAGGPPSAPPSLRSRVSDVATRPLNASGRLLDALTPAAPLDGAGRRGRGVPALGPGARREGVERLREALARRAEAMGPRAVMGREAIERVAGHATRALGKIAAEGSAARLTVEEGLATEAVILADPRLRPVLFVQDDRVARGGEDLGEWAERLDHFADRVAGAVRSVGRIEAPWLGGSHAGTGFAVAPGLVLTNRHVLEAVAVEEAPGAWRFGPGVAIDFAAERGRERVARFPVSGVAHAPREPILGTIDFSRLDLAVLRCDAEPAGGDAAFPEPLVLEADGSAYDRGREVYAVGYPARPLTAFGEASEGAAPPGAHEFLAVQRTLFDGTFGVKRWSAGKLMDAPGSLPGDEADWVVNHDATTLGGSSGSCVVDFASDGARVMGLHFGGRSRAENWAHALAALRETLEAQGARFAR